MHAEKSRYIQGTPSGIEWKNRMTLTRVSTFENRSHEIPEVIRSRASNIRNTTKSEYVGSQPIQNIPSGQAEQLRSHEPSNQRSKR
jgi:hypothetical protein